MTAKLRNVLLLDPRGVVVSGGKDVIDRQSAYGLAYRRLKGNSRAKLIIISSGNLKLPKFGSTPGVKGYVICKPTFNSFKFALLAYKLIKRENLKMGLLVAGDPWESFWSAYFLRIFLRLQIPIQIQVHGDIADFKWRGLNPRNRIRFLLARKSLKQADGIRAVSSTQAAKLVNEFNLDPQVITVIPIPINTPKLVSKFKVRPKTLGFIGRIHNDRGLADFLTLVKNLYSVSKNFKVIIAGSGPEEFRFLTNLGLILPTHKIVFHGQLNSLELQNVWNETGVLVSTAPLESYGRVLRESLLYGVPVWATNSSGVSELKTHWNKGSYKILNVNTAPHSLYKQFINLLKVRIRKSDNDNFIKDNMSCNKRMAQSWAKLIA
jgi:glycosyltransferase involved in cell wall biosynthesis